MEDAERNQKSGSNASSSSAPAGSLQPEPSLNNGAATNSKKQVVEEATDIAVENSLQESNAKVAAENDTSAESELRGGVHTRHMNTNDSADDGRDPMGEKTILESLPVLLVSVDINAAAQLEATEVSCMESQEIQASPATSFHLDVDGYIEGDLTGVGCINSVHIDELLGGDMCNIQNAGGKSTEEDSLQGGSVVEPELIVQGCGEGISQDEAEVVVEAIQLEICPVAKNKKFIDLPRHMLQALSKKNGIRANLTNVAMANALQALDTVIGIEITTNAIDGHGELEKRSSKRDSTMDDTNMIEKAMNLVAKKNSLNPGCLQGSILAAFLVPITA
ncbi:unnamed protein product [Urochloa humidicola]